MILKNRSKQASKYNNVPNLIWIAGVMKSGTSWLRDKLVTGNPLVANGPFKEVSFFLEAELRHYRMYDHENEVLSDSHTMTKKYGYVDEVIEQISAQRKLQFKNSFLKYYKEWINPPYYELSEKGFQYYDSFIQDGRKRKYILDSSVENAMLSPSTIQRVKDRYPNFKVIILLRDPISRLLSHANMMFANNEDHGGWYKNVDEFLQGYNANNHYDHIISNFRSVLDEDQLLIRFHDEITDEPQKLLEEVRDFIGFPQLNTTMKFPEYHPVNNIEFTAAQKGSAVHKLIDQIEFCVREFPDSPYPVRWLSRYLNEPQLAYKLSRLNKHGRMYSNTDHLTS